MTERRAFTETQGRDSARRRAVAILVVLAAGALAFPGAVLADNCGDAADCWSDVLKAALAAAAAAVLAAQIGILRAAVRFEKGPDEPRNTNVAGIWYASTSAADIQHPKPPRPDRP